MANTPQEARLLAVLADATGRLTTPAGTPAGDLARARRAVAQAVYTGQVELFDQIDVLDQYAPSVECLSADASDQIRAIARETLEAALPDRVRVVRRTLPVPTAGPRASIPAWAVGWKSDGTLGPFEGPGGRAVWFELRTSAPQLPIVESGRGRTIGALTGMAVAGGGSAIPLGVGSVWLLATLFDAAAPAGACVGVRVTGGTLAATDPIALINGTLRVAAGSVFTLRLDLEEMTAPPVPPAGNGGDARTLAVRLPRDITWSIGVGGAGSLTTIHRPRLDVYGSRFTFGAPSADARYDPDLGSLLFPVDISPDRIDIGPTASAIFRPDGGVPVRGAWAIAVTMPSGGSIVELGHAAGAGTLVLSTARPLRADVRAPQGDSVATLKGTHIVAAPGVLVVSAAPVATSQRRQTVTLWRDDEGAGGRLELDATAALALDYQASALGDGAEALRISGLALRAQLDRPVTAAGDRIPFTSDRATVDVLRIGGGMRMALEAPAAPPLDPVSGRPEELGPLSLALTNALLRVSGPIRISVAGAIAADGVERGSLRMWFGFRQMWPTLPDPYASSFSIEPHWRDLGGDQTSQLLYGHITWSDPRTAKVGFELLTRSAADPHVFAGRPVPVVPTLAPDPEVREQELVERLEQMYRRITGSAGEWFRLLDVSSRADWVGIGIGPSFAGQRGAAPTPGFRLCGMEMMSAGNAITFFTLPSFQWEPLYNLPNPDVGPFPDQLISATDGGPTRLGMPLTESCALAPLAVINVFVAAYNEGAEGVPLAARLTLPFGMVAMAELRRSRRELPILRSNPGFEEIRPEFPARDLVGGLQVRLTAPPPSPLSVSKASPSLSGATVQLTNGAGGFSALGTKVQTPFNATFGPGAPTARVPVTQIDLSGYGASLFSDWRHEEVKPPGVTQVRFDAMVGRTSHEVVQVKSIMYPWGIIVVRTITINRTGSGGVFRRDSGWQAASDGEYRLPSGMVVHAGVVMRLTDVRRIRDTTTDYNRIYGPSDPHNSTPGQSQNVQLTQVLFDADAQIDGATLGVDRKGSVPVRDLVGYVQLQPIETDLLPAQLDDLLAQTGPIGGPIDCEINVGQSGLFVRVGRIEVDRTTTLGNMPQMAAVARGAVELPHVGQWTTVYRGDGEADARRLPPTTSLPLVRANPAGAGTQPYRFADPSELHRFATPRAEYGFLHATGAQRLLVRQPHVVPGDPAIRGGAPVLFADTYALAGGVASFPRAEACHRLPAGSLVRITGRRKIRLEIPQQPGLGAGEFPITVKERTLTDASGLRIRGRFRDGATITLQVDSDAHPDWRCRIGPVGAVGDIAGLEEILEVFGTITSSTDQPPQISDPQVAFGSVLSPVQGIIDLLTLFGLGVPLSVSLTNAPYTFKSFGLLRFPPPIGNAAQDVIGDAIKHGLGVAVELELQVGMGREGDTPGDALEGIYETGGAWYFFLEITAKIMSEILRPIPFFIGGMMKVEIVNWLDEAGANKRLETKIYAGVAGKIELKLSKLAKAEGGRSLCVVTRRNPNENKVAAGTSSEYELGVSLLDGLAAAKVSFEVLLLVERHTVPVAGKDEFEFAGEAVVAIDVTLAWIANKRFEVEMEFSEEFAAAAFVAGKVLGV